MIGVSPTKRADKEADDLPMKERKEEKKERERVRKRYSRVSKKVGPYRLSVLYGRYGESVCSLFVELYHIHT